MTYPSHIRNTIPFDDDDQTLWTDVYGVGQTIAWLSEKEWAHHLAQDPHQHAIADAYARALFSLSNGHRRRPDTDPSVQQEKDLRAQYLRERVASMLLQHRRDHAPERCRWCGGSPAEPAIAVCRYESTKVLPTSNVVEVLRREGSDVVVRQGGKVWQTAVGSFIDYRDVVVVPAK
ncbi:hypothetical protein [Amycolatopsis sp. cmx-4-61]|uniref:hypothetical protein n=1 Tax=Amycolatopsis sp. cmx-4-61 TaxID=2790937 RepID=UPI00397E4661